MPVFLLALIFFHPSLPTLHPNPTLHEIEVSGKRSGLIWQPWVPMISAVPALVQFTLRDQNLFE